MKINFMTMMMDMEMEMEIQEDMEFVSDDIDFDYEFDAARFFDFNSPETTAQARQAEIWFLTAGSYCPSPFAANLVLREEDPKPNAGSKQVCGSENVSGSLGVGVLQNVAMQPGMTFNSKAISGNLNSKAKSAARKGSTLMKPTASQLAKQNQPPQIIRSRLQKEMNLSTSDRIESQAAKRQKLEGGLLRKVGDVKQQATFVHKAPKKVVTVDGSSGHSKLKITIPREPDLKTAHRAERIRPKNVAEAEFGTVAAPRFKARRLNRKILDAPSLPIPKRSNPRLPEFHEFHLKTSERAMQHTPAASSSTLQCDDSDKVNLGHTFDLNKHTTTAAQENIIRDLRRPSGMGAPKHDAWDFANNFKARPLNKKILSSKGEIGVFLNRKQETTVPTEFNFHTEKRVHHNLPIDLFSKLSLTSEVQSNSGSNLKPPRNSRVFKKDSKENMGSSFHLNQKEKPFIFGEKQTQSEIDGSTSKAGTLLTARRSLGIR